jgi:hypothetical protein
MPRLAEFGRSLALSNPHSVAETLSRHAEVIHSLGLGCRPVGTDSGEPRSVALIVTLIAIEEPSTKGYLTWQFPSSHQEVRPRSTARLKRRTRGWTRRSTTTRCGCSRIYDQPPPQGAEANGRR